MRATGTSGFWSMHSQSFVIKHYKKLTEGLTLHEYIKEKNRQKNAYEKLKANDFIQNCWTNIKLLNPKAFSWI